MCPSRRAVVTTDNLMLVKGVGRALTQCFQAELCFLIHLTRIASVATAHSSADSWHSPESSLRL